MPTKETPAATEARTFTEAEVEANFVPRATYEEQLKQNEKLVKALNKLLSEYNDLHIKVLLGE